MASFAIPSLLLNDGHKMPILALGTLALPDELPLFPDLVYQAIQIGYRHFDSAAAYGTAAAIGQAVRKAMAEGLVTRDQIFVSSKIFMTHMKREDLISQANEINEETGLQYMDLLLLHGPLAIHKKDDGSMAINPDGSIRVNHDIDVHTESWAAMEELVANGLVRSIGVSNYGVKHLQKTIANAKVIKPAVNQVESTPFLQHKELLLLCQQYGITMVAYKPLGGAVRLRSYLVLKDNEHEVNRNALLQNSAVNEIAVKYGKTVPQILLKFHAARGVGVVAKSMSKDHMASNADIFDFDLNQQDMERLLALDCGKSCAPEPIREMIKSFNPE